MSFDESDLRRRMNGAINSLKEEFIGLRTGRASTALLILLKLMHTAVKCQLIK